MVAERKHERFRRAAQHSPSQWLTERGAPHFTFRCNSDHAIDEAPLTTLPVFLAFHRQLRNVPRYRLVINSLDAALRRSLAAITLQPTASIPRCGVSATFGWR